MSGRKSMQEPSGWSRFWIRSSRRASERRRARYGIEPPRPVARLLLHGDEPIGWPASLRLVFYVLVGSPTKMAGLFWRYLTDQDTPKRRARIEILARELEPALSPGARVLRGYFERRLYSRDLARVPRFLERALHHTTPKLVVQPRLEADVQALMAFASRHRLPVFPRGVSSSAFGGAVPTLNGITLDLSSLDRILHVDVERRTARVQAGVRWAGLAEHARLLGLAPLASPSSRFSTVGGWAAAGGLGIESFGYGHFREAIEKVRVVLPGGKTLDLAKGDEDLRYFIGTEGQFGIITELTLRLRDLPTHSSPRLFHFSDASEAFLFLDQVVTSGIRPSHVAYYDPNRMEEENLFFRDRTGLKDGVVPEKDAVLLHFDDEKEEAAFLDRFKTECAVKEADEAASHFIWAERFFPMKFTRIGPGLLASEVMLSRALVPEFLEQARRVAGRFGTTLSAEVFVCRLEEDAMGSEPRDCVVITSFRCDPRRRIDYFLRLLLVQLLVHLGVSLGGRPYGFGIWNSPFLHRGVPLEARKKLVARKLALDPHLLLNPMKFFRLRTRLFNLPGLLFLPPVYGFTLGVLRVLSPVVGGLARLLGSKPPSSWAVPDPGEDGGRFLLRETALRCVFCGACVSCCPAYLLTGDERSTGRGKLRLSETLSWGGNVGPEDRAALFSCLHCGLCEEVCQAGLPLTECYDALEARIERDFGKPREALREFGIRVDANRGWIRDTFGLQIAEWTPDGCVHPLPAVKAPAKGGAR